jgi:hypothetical protein
MVGPPLAGQLIDLTHDYRYSAYVALAGGIVSLAAIGRCTRRNRNQTTCRPGKFPSDAIVTKFSVVSAQGKWQLSHRL